MAAMIGKPLTSIPASADEIRSSANPNKSVGVAIPTTDATTSLGQSSRSILHRAAGTTASADAPSATLPNAMVSGAKERSDRAIQRKAEPKIAPTRTS